MRRSVWVAALAALLLSVTVSAGAGAEPPSYSSTITVFCDGGTPGVNVTGNLYRNYGDPNEKLLYLDGNKMFVFWGLTCPDGSSTPISITHTTKWAPTDAVIGWTLPGICAATAAFTVPVDSFNPPTACFGGRMVRVTLPIATKN
jgi:hypothetical protein